MLPRLQLSHEVANERAGRATAILAADPRVRLVFLFGSAADPKRSSVGDIDLAVLTKPPLALDEHLHLAADLAGSAGPGIDLVSLNDAPVVLAHEVVTGGRCLFARSSEDEETFVVRTVLRFLDFKYYLDRQWQIAGERLAERQRGLAG